MGTEPTTVAFTVARLCPVPLRASIYYYFPNKKVVVYQYYVIFNYYYVIINIWINITHINIKYNILMPFFKHRHITKQLLSKHRMLKPKMARPKPIKEFRGGTEQKSGIPKWEVRPIDSCGKVAVPFYRTKYRTGSRHTIK